MDSRHKAAIEANEHSQVTSGLLHLAAMVGIFLTPFLLRKFVDISDAAALRGTIVAVSFIIVCSVRDIVFTLVKAIIMISQTIRYASIRRSYGGELPRIIEP